MKRPHWRKMTWALILWSALIIVWVVAGAGSADCANEASSASQSGCEAGTAIGVFLILFIGFVGFVFLSLIWFMTRPKGRNCPVCGEKVKKGLTTCGGCGYDFTQIAGSAQPPAQSGEEAAPLDPSGSQGLT